MENNNEAVNYVQPSSCTMQCNFGKSLPDSGDEQNFSFFKNLTTLFPVHSFSSFVYD